MGVRGAANVALTDPMPVPTGPPGADAPPPPLVTSQDLPPCTVARLPVGGGAGRGDRLPAPPWRRPPLPARGDPAIPGGQRVVGFLLFLPDWWETAADMPIQLTLLQGGSSAFRTGPIAP
jgi:hypothetical protein